MREVDVDDARHQAKINYHDLEPTAGRNDKRQMSWTEHVTHMTDCDETAQTLTIHISGSAGNMLWQEGNRLMKNCSQNVKDR